MKLNKFNLSGITVFEFTDYTEFWIVYSNNCDIAVFIRDSDDILGVFENISRQEVLRICEFEANQEERAVYPVATDGNDYEKFLKNEGIIDSSTTFYPYYKLSDVEIERLLCSLLVGR